MSQAFVGVSLLAMQAPRYFSYTALSFIASRITPTEDGFPYKS
ncbi:hypothetical protein OU5_3538 [Pseudomonas mandelii JR-1]|uniref:Uncharacterized protein n=1 Tax=Pseudomonas mandelii JR-1 TaxID=1147786 RepID=A0A024ECT4_9PSED|nr:hypothetical protein OU5_3538 [Pseudomonas mandelii JR-1]